MLELRDLTAQYSATPDWEMADDHEVETAMTDIKTWESKLKKIKKEQIKIESSIARHDINDLDDEIDALNTRIKLTKTELEEATQAIKDADISKGLYTNRKTRSTPLKLPTFSGRPGEDKPRIPRKIRESCCEQQDPQRRTVGQAPRRPVRQGSQPHSPQADGPQGSLEHP